ncbi:sialin isoform X1 [Ixodes scapularis]|uniref:sialin isoform X1 n=1 Tax=Ixodes scapularis TaxID=6945 RepID=UPI001A9D6257|nr:sialin isoform X1 [Ixodes scapularis]
MEHTAESEVVRAAAPKSKACLPMRYVMCFMISLGMCLVYSMRVNLSVTIIAMVNTTATDANSTHMVNMACPAPSNQTSPDDSKKTGEFLWDQVTQSYVLNAFFYGYIITQIPGGWLSEVISPAWILGGGIGITAMLTLFTAVVARASLPAFLVLRALEGISEGVTYPSLYALVARWSPVRERSFLVTVCIFGSLLGTVITLPVAAVLCEHGFDGGWPSVFYLTGLLGFVWVVVWFLLSSATPEQNRLISLEERKYIVDSRDCKFGVQRSVPWIEILLSQPVWMCALIKFCSAWSFYTLLTELPSYLENVLHFKIQKNGLFNAGFYLSQGVMELVSSYSADRIIERRLLGVTSTRKVFQSISLLGQAVIFVCLASAGCNTVLACILLFVACSLAGAHSGCDSVLPIDLAPEFAGSVMGLVNTVASTAGIFAPMLVGYLTENNESLERWDTVFYVSAAINLFGGVVFLIFGTAKVQPWAHPQTEVVPDTDPLIPSINDDPGHGAASSNDDASSLEKRA